MAAAIVPAFYPYQGPTMRDVLAGLCRQRFPTVALENDYYIFILSEIDAETLQSFSSDEEVYAHIDNLFASETGGRLDQADALLRYHPRTDSDFSVRLFPGDPAEHLYCLDFVRNDTGYAVNSLFEFELWAGAWPRFPLARVFSIEDAVGLVPESILPGEEKFVLKDGYTCLLKRKGRKDMVFMVPVRGGSNDDRRRTTRSSTWP
ncbi:hypothetical protein LXA43DRAFT_1095819 [Ganoderma leucocontextum]|nr:hypothetical protein LXA43DRAFT_1095819 [Ganoderma leucocontextum]